MSKDRKDLINEAFEGIYKPVCQALTDLLARLLPELAKEKVNNGDIVVLMMNLSVAMGSLPIELIPVLIKDQKLDYKFIEASVVNKFRESVAELVKDKKPEEPHIILN